MRPKGSRRSTSSLKTVALVLTALLIGGAATVGGLWAAGVDLPFLNREPDTRGMMKVPITTRKIPAFTNVTRDYLLIPEKGTPKYLYLPPEMAKHLEVLTDFRQILGRVVDHEKPPGYPFTEKDFLPKGTRSGMVAGIPPGKRAMTVEATKLQGIHALRVGDRLDLLSSQSIDMQKVLTHGKGASGASALQVGVLAQQKQATVRVLVQNGMLIAPVTTRVVPIVSNSLTQGTITRTKPIQEVIIAVDPEEIAPLAEALAIEAFVTCVARSGLPDDPGPASVTPSGPSPADQVAVVERIVGGVREVMFTPKGGSGPMMDTRGMIAVPLCGKPIVAGTKIKPEHLLDPATHRPYTVHIRPGDVRRLGLVTDATRIVGRVASRRKDPDTAFKEEDFLPEDAASSPMAAATPPAPAFGAGVIPLHAPRRPQ
jgi:Flp pilus assembly protein CpaB